MQIHALDRAKMLFKSYNVLRSSQMRLARVCVRRQEEEEEGIKPLKLSD